MAAFLGAFRLSRKKTTQTVSSDGSTAANSPPDSFTQGMAYEQMSGYEPQPTPGPVTNNMHQLEDPPPQPKVVLVESEDRAPPAETTGNLLAGSAVPVYTVVNDYVTFTRDFSSFSGSTRHQASALKMKMELFYKCSVDFAVERNKRGIDLENEICSDYRMSEERRTRRVQQHSRQENQYLRLRRARLCADDFSIIKVIGRGAYGEVCLVQKKDNGKIYAMKTLLKAKMGENDLAHVKSERDVMADSDSPWVVNLFYSFQDTKKLYLIMEFLPGGDMMTMLIKYEIFTEDITRFYIAQIVLAIDAVHKMGFIHRDIKPDNILLDKDGHVKLSDFGLSTGFHKTHDVKYYQKLLQRGSQMPKEGDNHTKNRNTVMVDKIHLELCDRCFMNTWRKSRRLMAYSTVGTPDYIAPEVLQRIGYTHDCDWWSLGAIMYECLVGWPPFCAEDQYTTTWKIANYKDHFYFPDEIPISHEAEDLIRALLTEAEDRLGRHGVEEIKAHPFFNGVDWENLRSIKAPFRPTLTSITDTSYFPTEFELNSENYQLEDPEVVRNPASGQIETDTALPFIGYTYKRFSFPVLQFTMLTRT